MKPQGCYVKACSRFSDKKWYKLSGTKQDTLKAFASYSVAWRLAGRQVLCIVRDIVLLERGQTVSDCNYIHIENLIVWPWHIGETFETDLLTKRLWFSFASWWMELCDPFATYHISWFVRCTIYTNTVLLAYYAAYCVYRLNPRKLINCCCCLLTCW